MKVLVVGSGGREHALVWKLAQSPKVSNVLAASGNPGTAALARNVAVKAEDVEGLVSLARAEAIDLVVVGPEAALEKGLVDALRSQGIAAFGPTQAAARLETSKAFAKAFMARHQIPTAAFETFDEPAAAKAALDRFAPPYVIKASGLAAGKGVVIAPTRAEAEAAIDEMLGGRFGAAGAEIVIEEHMQGEEASMFFLCAGGSDPRAFVALPACQDHKRAFDGDRGPNTGGMGAYLPAPIVDDETARRVEAQIVVPTLAGMIAEGAPFSGVLYVGLMITGAGPKVVEYNVRFGDPECQILMAAIGERFAEGLYALAAEGRAQADLFASDPGVGAAACVVLAAKGYPGAPETGSVIKGIEAAERIAGVRVFHAGTALDKDGTLRASGGRVLNVIATGVDIGEAIARAYEGVDAIDWPGGFHRRDIAARALDRSAEQSTSGETVA